MSLRELCPERGSVLADNRVRLEPVYYGCVVNGFCWRMSFCTWFINYD